MNKFECKDYLNSVRANLEAELGRKMLDSTFDSVVVFSAENAGQCLEDEGKTFESDYELYDEYFQASIEQFDLRIIEDLEA